MIFFMRFFTVLILLTTLSSMGITTASAEGGASFSIRPMRYDPARPATKSYFIYDAIAGQVIHDQVQISNTGTQAGRVRLYAVDAATGQTSGAVYLSAADPRQDVGAWISLDQQELDMEPGEVRAISFTVSLPQNLRPGEHLGAIAVESVAVQQGTNEGALQINMQTRMVTAVQVNLPGAAADRLTSGDFTSNVQQGFQMLQLTLRNEGDLMVKPEGSLVVQDAEGNTVQQLSLKLDTLLPQSEILYPVAIERSALSAGRYHGILDLAYGQGESLHYEGDFTISEQQVTQLVEAQQQLLPPEARAAGAQSGVPIWVFVATVLIMLAGMGFLLARQRRSAQR